VIHYAASTMNRQTGTASRNHFLARLACPFMLLCVAINTMAAGVSFDHGFVEFDDAPLEEPLAFPDWFKLSFLDLREDIEEVREAGKQGLIVYFGQKYCAYCKQFLEADLEAGDIQAYLRQHFDIIGIDIRRPYRD
jgi:thioredoxin-related protein